MSVHSEQKYSGSRGEIFRFGPQSPSTEDQIRLNICTPEIFSAPEKLSFPPPWVGHIPFAKWITAAMRPKLFVELGTHTGNSYFAFCEAVKSLSLSTACYAVDSWKGDPHSGFYSDEIFQQFKKHHDSHYAAFSTPLRSTFDEALSSFSNGSIDLIHFDGYHTYEVSKHDFHSWRPKIADNAIILIHDVNVRHQDFGVWKLWDELIESGEFRSFKFLHSNGLGVLGRGTELPEVVQWFFTLAENDYTTNRTRAIFSTLGESLVRQVEVSATSVNPAFPITSLPESDPALNATAQNSDLKDRIRELEIENERLTIYSGGLEREIGIFEQKLIESSILLDQINLDRNSQEALYEKIVETLEQTKLLGEDTERVLIQSILELLISDSGIDTFAHCLNRELDRFNKVQSLKANPPTRLAERLSVKVRGKRFVLRALCVFPEIRSLARRIKALWDGRYQIVALEEKQLSVMRRSQFFDEAYYRKTYPDVEAWIDPVMHFHRSGAAEGRNPSLFFDTNFYLKFNPDVALSMVNPLYHFLTAGFKEGRSPHPALTARRKLIEALFKTWQ